MSRERITKHEEFRVKNDVNENTVTVQQKRVYKRERKKGVPEPWQETKYN